MAFDVGETNVEIFCEKCGMAIQATLNEVVEGVELKCSKCQSIYKVKCANKSVSEAIGMINEEMKTLEKNIKDEDVSGLYNM